MEFNGFNGSTYIHKNLQFETWQPFNFSKVRISKKAQLNTVNYDQF